MEYKTCPLALPTLLHGFFFFNQQLNKTLNCSHVWGEYGLYYSYQIWRMPSHGPVQPNGRKNNTKTGYIHTHLLGD